MSCAGSHGTPAARGAASAAPLASSGSATRRRRARAGPFGVQRAGSLFALRGFRRVPDWRALFCFGARHMSLNWFDSFAPPLRLAYKQLCSGTVRGCPAHSCA